MRKFLAIVAIIVLGILLYVYLDMFYEPKTGTVGESTVLSESEIVDGILDGDKELEEKLIELQKNVQSIATFNSKVTKVVYSNTLSDDELMKVVEFQQKYFDEELKIQNPTNLMFKKLKEELKEYEDKNIKIIGFESVAPEYVGDDKYMTYVKVKYILNFTGEKGDVFMGYIYKMDKNKMWKLYGFKQVDEFPIVK